MKDGAVYAPGGAYAQTKRCLEIIEEALAELGAGLSNVVRTRMFVTDISRWEDFGRAHGEAFADHPPTTPRWWRSGPSSTPKCSSRSRPTPWSRANQPSFLTDR